MDEIHNKYSESDHSVKTDSQGLQDTEMQNDLHITLSHAKMTLSLGLEHLINEFCAFHHSET